jgi:hypothetical protein
LTDNQDEKAGTSWSEDVMVKKSRKTRTLSAIGIEARFEIAISYLWVPTIGVYSPKAYDMSRNITFKYLSIINLTILRRIFFQLQSLPRIYYGGAST